ncbi:protein SPT2 homolog isoform X1 [Salvelinus namaycush]|uniref:Protein SPT2 homolog n=1 Tax=Salvelinus namaycush TaxID=8040 RepID=A0A8U1H8V1_SALNM|nr:protein SPT2 homolog isoform X1 [Salvelinus namaycush]
MDFENVLSIASQNQGLSSVPKRYSLQTGPPKKDPKVKGVNSAAVQAFLKKQEMESKKKEAMSMKKKEGLLAKRVELKSDRKARAMASRTKDNFRGYNGIPVVEEPKKRRSKGERGEEQQRSDTYDEDDEDTYEYAQTDSEPEPEPDPEPQIPRQAVPNSKPSKRPSGPSKPAPLPMNFAELLKLAQKKQFEPVEVKAKPSKKGEPERLRTADEIRELDLERKAKRLDKGSRDSRPQERERDRDGDRDRNRDGRDKSQASSSSSRKSTSDRDVRNGKQPHKSLSERPVPSGSGRKPKPLLPSCSSSERNHHGSAKPSQDRDRDRERPKAKPSQSSSSSLSGALSRKAPTKGASSQVSAKPPTPRPTSAGHKPTATSDLNTPRKGNPSLTPGRPGNSGMRPSTALSSVQARPQGLGQSRPQQGGSLGQARASQGSSVRGGPTGGPSRPGKGEPARPGGSSTARPASNGQMRPTAVGPPRPGGPPQARPGGGSVQGRPGDGGVRPPGNAPGRPGGGGPVPRRPASSMGSGPGRPKCTLVAETISSKTFGGGRGAPPSRPGMPPSRPGMPPNRPGMPPSRPGMPPSRPGMPPSRPGMQPSSMMRPQGMIRSPITSAYKRKYEDEEEEEYDSEMEDFIDDEGEDQATVSKHIKEIFGYDRTKYKEESDYALKFMESSWRDQQKEEARSLRLGIKEDEEELRLEEEAMKKKMPMNAKRKKV